jgi:hypothetical protein
LFQNPVGFEPSSWKNRQKPDFSIKFPLNLRKIGSKPPSIPDFQRRDDFCLSPRRFGEKIPLPVKGSSGSFFENLALNLEFRP